MKCHYEVLNISKEADDDDIKKSYRKLALKYHPDKNPDNIEECTRQFHLVQQAYDVLIDPQERAWYDKHREAILRGGLGTGDYEDNSLDIYQYFNAACYSGYGDNKEGFYGVYSEVFENLASEDLEFMEEGDSDTEYPEFGNSQSSYEEVVGPFYAFWESYCTAKSYVWVEKYDTREAPNRQIRRLMEQDNKKFRDKAKKERNEEVRALVGFVRKRDKRVQAHKKVLEERAAEIAKRSEERKKKDRERRRKDMESYEETGWSAMSGLENDLAQLEAKYTKQFGEGSDDASDDDQNVEGSEEEEDLLDDLFCVACNKEFKSDRAFANHEKSKKHKENVAFLKAQMLAEDQQMTEDAEGEDDVMKTNDTADDKQDDVEDDKLLEDHIPQPKLSKKQKKKRKQQQKFFNMVQDPEDMQDVDTVEDTMREADTLTKDMDDLDINERTTDDQNGNTAGEERITSQTEITLESEVPCENPGNESDSNTEPTETPDGPQTEHTALNTGNKEDNPRLSSTTKGKTKGNCKATGNENKAPSVPQICNKCGASFKTRNKLFQHVKETGHALRLDPPAAAAVAAGGNNKKKKKGKR